MASYNQYPGVMPTTPTSSFDHESSAGSPWSQHQSPVSTADRYYEASPRMAPPSPSVSESSDLHYVQQREKAATRKALGLMALQHGAVGPARTPHQQEGDRLSAKELRDNAIKEHENKWATKKALRIMDQLKHLNAKDSYEVV